MLMKHKATIFVLHSCDNTDSKLELLYCLIGDIHMAKLGQFLLFFLAFGVAGYAIFAYSFLPLGSNVFPEMKANFIAHSNLIYTHVFASVVALVIGPFQLLKKFRSNFKQVHRWLGRIYLLLGVLLGGLSGLILAQYASGGLVARIGFASLAVLWLYTGLRAYLSARRGAIGQHRKWMLRNFALTFAAVTLRLYLPIGMVSGFEFSSAYAVIAWLCWIPNLAFVEYRFNTTKLFAS